MDPEACLQLAETAASEGNAEQVAERLSDLCTWLSKGGFSPKNLDQRLAALNDVLTGQSPHTTTINIPRDMFRDLVHLSQDALNGRTTGRNHAQAQSVVDDAIELLS